MVKITFLMRRNLAMSSKEFSDYWLNTHVNLVKKHAPFLGIRRYVQSHIVGRDIATALRGGWTDAAEPWDGMAEVWLDSLDMVLGKPNDPEMVAVQGELMGDEQRFVDHARSALFITEEHVIVQ